MKGEAMINEDEYGSCPNCGESVHITEMGSEDGVVCCRHCYQAVRKDKMQEQTAIREDLKAEGVDVDAALERVLQVLHEYGIQAKGGTDRVR